MELKKGNIDEIRDSINERINLVLLKKDFSEKIFSRIKLTGASISSCTFNKCGFYGDEFTDTQFLSSSFKEGNFESVTFTNCTFFKCVFDDANFQNTRFVNCKILSCDWNNVKLSENVTGLSEDDLKVIHEATSVKDPGFEVFGFEKTSDEEYNITGKSNDVQVTLEADLDREMEKNVWRVMFFINNDNYLSDTIDVDESYDKDDAFVIIKSILINGKKKALKEIEEDINIEDLNKAFDEVKQKLDYKTNY